MGGLNPVKLYKINVTGKTGIFLKCGYSNEMIKDNVTSVLAAIILNFEYEEIKLNLEFGHGQ